MVGAPSIQRGSLRPPLANFRMRTLELDVVATRGGDVESRHRVHAAVVGDADTLIATAHDPSIVSSWRSCAKPFQIMPLVQSGGFDDLHWGDDQLALACASHGGPRSATTALDFHHEDYSRSNSSRSVIASRLALASHCHLFHFIVR